MPETVGNSNSSVLNSDVITNKTFDNHDKKSGERVFQYVPHSDGLNPKNTKSNNSYIDDFVVSNKIGYDFSKKKSKSFPFSFGKKSPSNGIPINTSVKLSNGSLPKLPPVPKLAKIPLPVQPPRVDAHTHSIIEHVTELRKLEKPDEQQNNNSSSINATAEAKALTEEDKVQALTANGFKADCLRKKEDFDKAWQDGTLMLQIQAWKGPVIIAVGKPGEKILYTYMKDEKGNPYLCHCESEQSAKQKLTIKQPIPVSPTALLNSLATSTETKYAIELYRIEKKQTPQPLYIDLTEQADKEKSKEAKDDEVENQDEHQQKVKEARDDLMTRLGIKADYGDELGLEIEREG